LPEEKTIAPQSVEPPIVSSEKSFDPEQAFIEIMGSSGFALGNDYLQLREQLNVRQQNRLDAQLLAYADLLFANRKKEVGTVEKLRGLLLNEVTDKAILRKIASILKEEKRYNDSISTLIELNHWSQYPSEFQEINALINEIVNLNIKMLNDRRDLSSLEAFYNYLVDTFPSNYQYRWEYAKFSQQQQNYDQALFLLDELRYVPEYSEQVDQLTENISFHLANSSHKFDSVELSKFGESYFVKAILNDQEPVRLLIDTGASMTIISPELAYSLGFLEGEPEKILRFQTANGEVSAPVIRLNSLSVGDFSVDELAVGILSVSNNPRIHGLLGMNFLKHYKFFIDQQNMILELTPRL